MSNSSKIDRVFADATDFEISSAAHRVFEKVYGFEAIQEKSKKVPYDRWVVHTVMANTGFFECNGYSYFWGTNHDHYGFAESLKVIGRPILSSVIHSAIEIVPKEILGDWDKAEAYLENCEKELENAAEHLDSKLITENPNIQECVSRYLRRHRESYSDVIDQIEQAITEHRRMFESHV